MAMAMAMKLAAQRGLLSSSSTRMFSSLPFNLPASETTRKTEPPSTNLFVSGLSKRTTSEGLREAFEKFGEVVHARVVTDRDNGYSKGFGFVRYGTIEDAKNGMEGMDGKFLDGWVIFAEYARERTQPAPPQFSGSPPSPRY
ncbi:hypothetical protein IFM89_026788 [Coptis chinensis]|uniref:RRM domain-containing protein n=1 Tax=Coptis chinensis TaxID=261450 RepID=A0A835GZJ6_9MAGN|nr:hypothetical protein IFM89_026788 [Coptis chinensis]